MKRFTLFIVALFLLKGIFSAFAQNFQTIDVNQGLSDRRVFSIQKDQDGFMWFLTYAGIDRFDGKNIKHYPISSEKGYIDSYSEYNILKTDSRGKVWLITPTGDTFVFNQMFDEFQLVELPQEITLHTFNLVELTAFDKIWYSNKEKLYIYDIKTNKTRNIKLIHQHSRITSVIQTEENHYIIGTEEGICHATIDDNTLLPMNSIIKNFTSADLLFYHPKQKRLFAGSENHGFLIYDLEKDQIINLYKDLEKSPISAIINYGDSELLISTQGNGLYKYHIKDDILTPYIQSDLSKQDPIASNNIRTVYLDEEERIWMSVYPNGISVYNRSSPQYKWRRHHIGNVQSISNDQINHIIEDADGDIWYATNNGVSLYRKKTDEWEHLFTEKRDFQTSEIQPNSTYLSLCEVRPGYILAGGYMSGIYGIDKKTMTYELITPYTINPQKAPFVPNKYIRAIYQDKNGYIWTGGHNYLGCSKKSTSFFEYYPLEHPITCIIEKDSTSLFVGTGYGIYLFDKNRKTFHRLRVPFASQFINTLYKHSNDVLYIGTTNSGLIALYPNGEFETFAYRNSSLISNNVYSIVPHGKDQLVISTEKTLAKFYIKEKRVKNWTVDNGLIETNFNPRAGIHTSDNKFIFGTARGAIEYADETKITQHFKAKIHIENIHIANENFNQELWDNGLNNLDSLKELNLSYNQNTFSIQLSTINYNTPNYTIIRWRINEVNEYWKRIPSNGKVEKKNLKPGRYTLQIQALTGENFRVIDTKALDINIALPFWKTPQAIILYIGIIIAIIYIFMHIIRFRKQQKFTKKKTEYFINTAINLRTPIQLIKGPLKEILQNKQLTQLDTEHLQTALRNCENLALTVSNIINTEKINTFENIEVNRYQLNTLIQQYINQAMPLTHPKEITIFYDNTENVTNDVWIDKNKIDIIFHNILEYIIKHIPVQSVIHINSKTDNRYWITQIYSDNNEISQPQNNSLLKKLYAKKILKKDWIETEDIDLQIIYYIAQSHRGELLYQNSSSAKNNFVLKIPLYSSKYTTKSMVETEINPLQTSLGNIFTHPNRKKEFDVHNHKGSLLIVSNNEEEISFLETVLSNEWQTIIAYSSKMSQILIQENEPDIIIIGTNIPDMHIDRFCEILKSNFKTSHIPILLLTSINDYDSVIHNLNIKADHYITKPFEIPILKATLTNMLENKTLLEKRMTHVDVAPKLKEIKTSIKENENKFLLEVKDIIMKNLLEKDFTIDSLCNIVGMSRSSLYAKVKAITGQPLNEIIKNIKLQKASEMLLSKNYNVMEVSDMLGFSEPKYFRAVFKKYYGITPSEYIRIKIKEKANEQSNEEQKKENE